MDFTLLYPYAVTGVRQLASTLGGTYITDFPEVY
jgi:hypothetical protein